MSNVGIETVNETDIENKMDQTAEIEAPVKVDIKKLPRILLVPGMFETDKQLDAAGFGEVNYDILEDGVHQWQDTEGNDAFISEVAGTFPQEYIVDRYRRIVFEPGEIITDENTLVKKFGLRHDTNYFPDSNNQKYSAHNGSYIIWSPGSQKVISFYNALQE